MHLVFLSARLPLTKTFVKQNAQIIAKPYPLVSRVTSHHYSIDTLNDFYTLLCEHAALQHCLFSGELQAPLKDESRAGKALKVDREWICFDFDKVKAKNVDEVIKRFLPKYCHDVSYISQVSSSMFLPGIKTWSGHVFMLLKKPAAERTIKQWFEHVNFSIPELEANISLTDSMQCLHWPLDRTVASTSNIVYIAPPITIGFTPKLKPADAITLVVKKQNALDIPAFETVSYNDIRKKINELRIAAGVGEIAYDVKVYNGEEVLIGSELCNVSGIRTSGNHYITFNINNGDSRGYYIDLRNIALIKNFKGEPMLRTEEAAPELYKSLKKTSAKTVSNVPLDDETDILAFYATNKASSVYIGSFSPIDRKLTLNNSSETAAKAWLNEYSLALGGYLPHKEVVFDPQSLLQYIADIPIVNTFRPTNYMTQSPSSATNSSLTDIPPAIQKTIKSMLGNPDAALFDHFIHWLAYVFQTKHKTQAAWVLHGTTGTGKSIFIKYILTPLFGPEHVKVVQFSLASGQFNGFLENSLFVVFEEADTKTVDNQSDLMAKLKHWITDSPIEINNKGIKPYAMPSYTNFIFNSNERTPVNIAGDDRRFNIANRQEQRLFLTPNELQVLFSGAELEQFADVLLRYKTDAIKASRILDTQAKSDIHEASTSINQLIAEAINKGDLQFFIDRMPSDSEAQSDFHNRFNPLGMYQTELFRYQEAAKKGEAMIMSEEQLFILFRTLISDSRFFQDSKTWRKRHFKAIGLDIDKQHRIPGKNERVRGLQVRWQKPEYLLPMKAENVTAIRSTK